MIVGSIALSTENLVMKILSYETCETLTCSFRSIKLIVGLCLKVFVYTLELETKEDL